MSKKMMKRSLVLGALMAFVITGSAFADSVNENDINNIIQSGKGILSIVGTNSNNQAAKAVSGNATISGYDKIVLTGDWGNKGKNGLANDRNIFYANNGILTINDLKELKYDGFEYQEHSGGIWGSIVFHANSGTIVLNSEEIDLENFCNGFFVQNDASMTVNAKNIVLKSNDTKGSAIGVMSFKNDTPDGRPPINIFTDNLTIETKNTSAISVKEGFYLGTTGEATNGSVNIVANKKVDITAKNGIYVRKGVDATKKAVVDVRANELQIKSTDAAILADTYGSVSVDAPTVELNNKGGAVAVHVLNGSDVTILGNNISISAEGDNADITAVKADNQNNDAAKVAQSKIIIGTANTNTIEVIAKSTAGEAQGIWATKKGGAVDAKASIIEVNGNSLKVDVEGKYNDGYVPVGIWAASNNENTSDANVPMVNVETANTTIDVKTTDGSNKAAAIMAMSKGIVNINSGNVYVTADNGKGDAVLARGGAVVNVGTTGKETVLNGNVSFNYNSNTSGSGIDASVNVVLDGENSSFNGKIYKTDITSDVPVDKSIVTGMTLDLSNGATWNVTGRSFVNTLNVNEGIIAFDADDADDADDAHVDVDAGSGSVILTEKGKTADDYNDAAGLTKVAERLGVKDEAITAKVVMAEGDIKGETTGVVTFVDPAKDEKNDEGAEDSDISATAEGDVNDNADNYWHGVVKEVTEKVNTKNQAIGEAGISLKLHWRAHMNDMNKRMGELRNAEGEHGVWARMVRGESEYKNTKAQYNQYQLGYDEKLSVDKRWTVGAAVTFAEGDANYGQGSTDDKSTAFAIYGSKLNNDGTFVDLIARYAHLESDLDDVNSGKGDYATNGMSVSAEFGKRIQQGNGLWIEPQAELTYGTIDSAEYKLGTKTVEVGDMDSLIGRVGFRIGKDLDQGNVYARASYLYDFDGETENVFSNATDSRTIAEDLGGGWWEVGVGANINLSKAAYVYADVEKTFGGEVDTNWQWNLGVRYSF